MAKKVTVTLVDDYDGSPGTVESVSFALDGASFEIDLNESNAAKLRAALQPFMDAGRRVGRAQRARTRPVLVQRNDLDAIRKWAHSVGKQVASRGRISEAIKAEYDAAMAQPVKKPIKKAAPKEATDVVPPVFSSSA